MPASVIGLLWGGGMLINFAWPRVASNPTPVETGKLLNFHWSWLNHRPVLWTVFVVVVSVGAAYYALVQRHKPIQVVAPEGELPAPATVA